MPTATTTPARPMPTRSDPPAGRVRLNVGGGKGHPVMRDWTVVDLRESADVVLDITEKALPHADSSVDLLVCSHTLEHVPRARLGFVLSEFLRVVKPVAKGGVVRIAVPDIEQACRAYVAGDEAFFRKADLTYADPDAPLGGLLASWFYSVSAVGNGHVNCFDFGSMSWWLKRAGFARVERSTYRGSRVEDLRAEGIDLHPHESLYVEAFKE